MLLLHEVGGPSILNVRKGACNLSHRLELKATPSRVFESLWFWWTRNYCHLVSNTSIHQKTLLHRELTPVKTCSTVLRDGIVGKWNDRVFEHPASRVRECGWGGGGDEHNLVTTPQYDRYYTVTDCEFEILGLSGDKDLPNKLARSVIPCTAEIMPTCKGCGLKVKCSGLFPRLRRIQDPRCKTYLKLLLDAQGVLRRMPKGKKQKKSSQTNKEPEPMILSPSKSTPNFVMGEHWL